MGDWIKENKFEAGLLFVVLVIAVGAYILGSGQGKKYQQFKDYYDAAAGQKKQLESKRPYPNQENLNDYEDEVDAYRQVVSGLQTALLKFRPKEFEDVAPSEFTERLNAAIASATQLYTGAGIEFPADKWRLGFERYTETPPREDATAYLSYQLEAMSWLFDSLASSKPSALVNVYRKELPVEEGKSMDAGEESSGSRSRSSRGSRGRGPQGASQAPYYSLPLELTFKASEASVRQFLASVASNPKHFFVIRSLRIQNEKPDKPPKRDDVEFKDFAAEDDAFGGTFDLVVPEEGEPEPEGEPAPEGEDPVEPLFPEEDPAAPSLETGGGERILGQILGAEEIFVFLELELILFKQQDNEEDEENS